MTQTQTQTQPTSSTDYRRMATLENIRLNALNLWRQGYRATEIVAGLCLITNPTGDTYEVDFERDHCTCPAHSRFRTCKHVQGAKELLRAQESEARYQSVPREERKAAFLRNREIDFA